MTRYLPGLGKNINCRIGVREGYRKWIEPCILVLAPFLRRRHLQAYGLRRHLYAWHGNFILRREIADSLDLGIARNQHERHRLRSAQPAHLIRGFDCLVPQRRKTRRAGYAKMHLTADERVYQ